MKPYRTKEDLLKEADSHSCYVPQDDPQWAVAMAIQQTLVVLVEVLVDIRDNLKNLNLEVSNIGEEK